MDRGEVVDEGAVEVEEEGFRIGHERTEGSGGGAEDSIQPRRGTRATKETQAWNVNGCAMAGEAIAPASCILSRHKTLIRFPTEGLVQI